MDTTGCPPGFATDNLGDIRDQLYPPFDKRCTVEVHMFIATCSVLILLKALLNVVAIRISYKLQKQRQKSKSVAGSQKQKNRIPWTTVAETVVTVLLIIILLVSLPTASGKPLGSAENRVTSVLLGTTMLVFQFINYLSSIKLIHLSQRLVMQKTSSGSRDSAPSNHDMKAQELSKLNTPLKILFRIQYVGYFIQVVCFYILIFAFDPTMTNNLVFRVGMGASFVGFGGSAIIIMTQITRIVKFIEYHEKEMSGQQTRGVETPAGKKARLRKKKLVTNLKFNRTVLFVTFPLSGLIFPLIAMRYPPFIHQMFYLECFVMIIVSGSATAMYISKSVAVCCKTETKRIRTRLSVYTGDPRKRQGNPQVHSSEADGTREGTVTGTSTSNRLSQAFVQKQQSYLQSESHESQKSQASDKVRT